MLDRLCISDNKAASNGGSRQAVHGQGCKSQEILIEWRDFYGLYAVSILWNSMQRLTAVAEMMPSSADCKLSVDHRQQQHL